MHCEFQLVALSSFAYQVLCLILQILRIDECKCCDDLCRMPSSSAILAQKLKTSVENARDDHVPAARSDTCDTNCVTKI